MKNSFSDRFLTFLKKFRSEFVNYRLYTKNLILRRKLSVYDVWCSNLLVIEGNSVRLFWKVKGCHKITVNNSESFRGDSYGATALLSENHNLLTIRFYGVGKIIIKNISLSIWKVNLLAALDAKTNMPAQIETKYSNTNLAFTGSTSELKASLNLWETSIASTVLEVNLSDDNYSQIYLNG